MLSFAVLFLLLLDILSAIVAFLISYHAFKFNRLLDNPALRAMSLGFTFLGIGLITEALTGIIAGATIADEFFARRLVADAGLVFLLLQLGAYIVLAWGYGVGAFRRKPQVETPSMPASAVPAAILVIAFGVWYNFALLAYLLMVVLLAFVVVEAALIYARTKTQSPLLVLVGFGLIFIGHVFMLDSLVGLKPLVFYEGTIIQFFGFLSLLWFLLRSGRIGSA